MFQVFTTICDGIFIDGSVNWRRIVAIYGYAVHLAKFVSDKANSAVNPVSPYNNLIEEQIATFVGQYVANKCGKWILNEGG
jgi:hypothetical protein